MQKSQLSQGEPAHTYAMTTTRPTRLFAIAAAAAISLTALVAVTPAASARPAKLVTVPGKVTVEIGDSVKVRLATNPSTGYSWKTTITGDKSAITVSKGVYKPPPGGGAGGSVGAAGVTVWTIAGKSAGTAVVTFSSIPPGGGSAAFSEKLTVTVP